jgi:hypothetical protein
MKNQEKVESWFKAFCRTDMQLDENILSKDEYAKRSKANVTSRMKAFRLRRHARDHYQSDPVNGANSQDERPTSNTESYFACAGAENIP